MSKNAVTNLHSMKRAFGELLEGELGKDLPDLRQSREACKALHGEIEKERQDTKSLRSGDVNVDQHKRTLKEKEASLKKANSRRESAAVRLGDNLCVVTDRIDITSFDGLTAAMEARTALIALRKEYDDLEPKPDAGLWAKGKAAAKRAIVSAKILLQEGKTNDLLKTVVYRAHQSDSLEAVRTSDTTKAIDDFIEATRVTDDCEAKKHAAATVLAEVETRVKAIHKSDKKIEDILAKLASKREEIVDTLLSQVSEQGTEGLPEQVLQGLEQVSEAMAVAETAAAAQGKESKGLFGALANAFKPPCPQCKKSGFTKIKKERISSWEFEGPAYRLPDGSLLEPGLPSLLHSGPKRDVLAVYSAWHDDVTYACPACGHTVTRREAGKVLLPPRAYG
jgi:hypothetical protein